MAVQVHTHHFEGPLDVLLHLIEKNEMDIYDIPIREIADQYMDFIVNTLDINLDEASDFVLMASTLMEIKSKQLLPEAFLPEEIDQMDPDDPRKELVEKLLEYKKYKQLSLHLKQRAEHFGPIHFRDQEDLIRTLAIDYHDDDVQFESQLIVDAMHRMLLNIPMKNRQPERFFKSLKRDLFTIEGAMERVRRLVGDTPKNLEAFIETEYIREEIVVLFLSLLELLKLKEIQICQERLYDTITIVKRGV